MYKPHRKVVKRHRHLNVIQCKSQINHECQHFYTQAKARVNLRVICDEMFGVFCGEARTGWPTKE